MFRRRRIAAKRMTKEWISGFTFIGDPPEPVGIPLAPGTIFSDWILPPVVALVDYDEPTVLRMIFNLITSVDAVVAQGGTFVHVGAIVTRDDGTGLAPFFDPAVQGYLDWLWTSEQAVVAPFSTASPPVTRLTSQEGLWDVRSKRKVGPGEGIALCMTNDLASLGGATVYWQGRTLLAHA